jgi:hypothetical protein
MKFLCSTNFFLFALVVSVLVLLFTEQFRKEGFEYAGVMTQLASTRAPTTEYFDSTGALIQLATTRAEPFDSTGALTQLAADHVPSVAPSPIMINHLINQKIYDNLTEQGLDRMTMDPTGYKSTKFAPVSF